MTAYYNEFDRHKAAWLRELIARGLIAPGDVDERDIRDIRPADLDGYTQVHLFAGIGIWSYALRRAGWTDDRPVWTASCPCQPFSQAGRGDGFDDERHLWPAVHHLARVCRPDIILGEQVASLDGLAWLDLVHADMEGEGYPIGAVDLCSAGVGSPNIRQRLYWMAYAARQQHDGGGARGAGRRPEFADGGTAIGLAYADRGQRGRLADGEGLHRDRKATGWQQGDGKPQSGCPAIRLGNPARIGCEGREPVPGPGARGQHAGTGSACGVGYSGGAGLPAREREAICGTRRGDEGRATEQSGGSPDGPGRPGPVNGFWRDADWLRCRDGRWRPVGPGTFPLVAGAPARVVRLRGYGDGLNAEAATAFVVAAKAALMEAAA